MKVGTTVAQKSTRQQDRSYYRYDSPSTPDASSQVGQRQVLLQRHSQKQPSSAPPQQGRSRIESSRRQGTPYRQRLNNVNAEGISSTASTSRQEDPTQQAKECSEKNDASAVTGRNASPPKQTRLDSAMPAVQPPPLLHSSSSSSTLPPTVAGGAVPLVRCANTIISSDVDPPGTPFRQRVIRTWWRGLSCGVCFAAGAWARDGHEVLGVALALAAVCGELMLHERVAATIPFDW